VVGTYIILRTQINPQFDLNKTKLMNKYKQLWETPVGDPKNAENDEIVVGRAV
jgi:hypothetical protein